MTAIATMPVLLGTGVHGSRPAASAVGKGGVYACSTHSLIYQADGSSWTTWAALTGTGLADPMTTRGDSMYRNSSNVTDRLPIPAAGKVIGRVGSDLGALYPPGYEFDYVQKTTNTSITGTSGSETTVVTGAAVTYDGSTIVMVEFYAAFAAPDSTASRSLTVGLFESTTEIARLCYAEAAVTTQPDYKPFYGRYRFTPTNASHTYNIKAWVSAGTGLVGGGAGGAAAAPCFMRITKVA